MHTLEHALVMPVVLSAVLSVCSLAFFLHDRACVEILRGNWIEQEERKETDMQEALEEQFLMRRKVQVQFTDGSQQKVKVSSEDMEQIISVEQAPAIEKLQRYQVIFDSVEEKLKEGNGWK